LVEGAFILVLICLLNRKIGLLCAQSTGKNAGNMRTIASSDGWKALFKFSTISAEF